MAKTDNIAEQIDVLKATGTVQLLSRYKELFGDNRAKSSRNQLAETSGQFKDESWILAHLRLAQIQSLDSR